MLNHAIETATLRLGLYEPLRDLYHATLNRPYRQQLLERQRLFERFIHPDDLVFDLGANHGDFAVVFRRLQAHVICVEPNPPLAAKLRGRFGAENVVEAAVGDQVGSATLYLGSDSNYSTIVPSWLGITKERDRLSTDTVTVPVTTLDTLIARFGTPAFVKIDVEANELAVLRGLSHAVNGLIFEYQCPRIDEVPAMVDHLDTLAIYRYAYLHQGALQWGTRAELWAHLTAKCATGVQSGDIYAQRTWR